MNIYQLNAKWNVKKDMGLGCLSLCWFSHKCEMTTLSYFLIQEGGKAEENMAQKRAALLEKRMRREKETQQKKMQLEAELEQKKEEARYVTAF